MNLILAVGRRSKGFTVRRCWSPEKEDAAVGGSGVEVFVALVVLVLRECDDGLRRDEAETVAR